MQPPKKMMTCIPGLLVGGVLVWLAASAFQGIIDNSFVLDDEPGLPTFYLIAGEVAHIAIALITISFALAAMACAMCVVDLCRSVKNLHYQYKGHQVVNIILLLVFITATIYFIIVTPVETSDVASVRFTMTDGTIANLVITSFQQKLFYALGGFAIVVAIVLSISSIKNAYSYLSVLLLCIAGILLSVYFFMDDDTQRLPATLVATVIPFILLIVRTRLRLRSVA
jgi:hypothetical protein